jgi:hypothetical protein
MARVFVAKVARPDVVDPAAETRLHRQNREALLERQRISVALAALKR